MSCAKSEFQLMYNHMNALIKKNCVRPFIGTTYPLAEAAKAHHDVINNTGTTGRLTLLI